MNGMYTAEQINIPPELGTILKQYTKAVIRERPQELYKFSANFFASLAGMMPPFDEHGELTNTDNRGTSRGADNNNNNNNVKKTKMATRDMMSIIEGLFRQYDINGNGRVDKSEIPALVNDLKGLNIEDYKNMTSKDILDSLDVDKNGTINLEEFRLFLVQ